MLLLVRLSWCYISQLLFHFRFAVLFLHCCSISGLLFYFLIAIYHFISCHLLFWCEGRSHAVVSIDIYCLAPKSTIYSLVSFSISLQRDGLLLPNPWLINCLVFWIRRSQSVYCTLFTLFNALHTLLKASKWMTFCPLVLSILHYSTLRGCSHNCLSCTLLLTVSPNTKSVCIHAGFLRYAYIHLDRCTQIIPSSNLVF